MVAYEKGWLPEGRRADAHHRDQRVSFPLDVIRLSASLSHSLSLAFSLSFLHLLVSLPCSAVARASPLAPSPVAWLVSHAISREIRNFVVTLHGAIHRTTDRNLRIDIYDASKRISK